MTGIQKAPETMNSKKRVLKTFAFEKTDRVPIDYSSNPTIHMAFCRALGIPDGNYAALLELLGVDYRSAWPRYTGPKLFPDVPVAAVQLLSSFGKTLLPIHGAVLGFGLLLVIVAIIWSAVRKSIARKHAPAKA